MIDINKLKALNVAALDMEELSFQAAQVSAIAAGYAASNLAAPEWFKAKQGELADELAHRTRAEKKRQLELLLKRREALRTPDEKRAATDAAIEALQKELQ